MLVSSSIHKFDSILMHNLQFAINLFSEINTLKIEEEVTGQIEGSAITGVWMHLAFLPDLSKNFQADRPSQMGMRRLQNREIRTKRSSPLARSFRSISLSSVVKAECLRRSWSKSRKVATLLTWTWGAKAIFCVRSWNVSAGGIEIFFKKAN